GPTDGPFQRVTARCSLGVRQTEAVTKPASSKREQPLWTGAHLDPIDLSEGHVNHGSAPSADSPNVVRELGSISASLAIAGSYVALPVNAMSAASASTAIASARPDHSVPDRETAYMGISGTS